MTEDDAEDYWNAITAIEAQDTLVAFTISQWPDMSNSDRERIHRKLHSQAYPESFIDKKPLSAEHLQRLLQGR